MQVQLISLYTDIEFDTNNTMTEYDLLDELELNDIIIKTLEMAIPQIDILFLNSTYRKNNYYKFNSNRRSFTTIFGDLEVERYYYTDKKKKNGDINSTQSIKLKEFQGDYVEMEMVSENHSKYDGYDGYSKGTSNYYLHYDTSCSLS